MAVTDMSGIVDGFPSYGASQHAGNTVSDAPQFGAAGSVSEATHGIDTHDTPDVTMPARADLAQFVPAGDDVHGDFGWTTPDVAGEGWSPTSD